MGTTTAIPGEPVLVQPLRVGDAALTERYEAILSNSHDFRLEPITAAIARRAADLRARYNLRTPDALHVATAIAVGCDAFLTNDTGVKRVAEITILVLDELELDSPQA
jgi:predicted nucleic acid-binding protein